MMRPVSETDEEAALLGRIAVRYGFITMEQLSEATRERGRGGQKLGAIMLERGMLDELALGKVLALQKRHRDALAKKSEKPANRGITRKRIPTPKDWAFDAPKARSQAAMPRRERRTGDVVRDHLTDDVTNPAAVTMPSRNERPRAIAPAALRSFDKLADEARELDLELDTESPERETRRRRTLPDMPRSERPTPPEAPREPPAEVARRQAVTPPITPRALAATPATQARPRPSDPAERTTKPEMPRVQEAESEPSRAVTPTPRISEPAAVLEPLPWEPPKNQNPRVAFLHELLEHAVRSRASDVHVHAGTVGRMRQLGQLVPITEEPLAAEATDEALTAILTPWQHRRFMDAGEIDLAYQVKGLGRFRANVYRQHNGTNGVFHVISESVPTLAGLGLPPSLAQLTNYSQGLVLLTGPAGSGKTSTLAALTNIINEERTDHILTIEDPIEYVFRSKRCIINQRQVGRHTESFASGLRGALREDPDIICIGELRDLETISLALSAAETGHLVLATLHTGSAIGTINRIVGAYPPGQQPQVRAMMSESLRAVTSQRLLPTTDGGSVVALETLFITRAVGALIRDNRTFQIGSIMQTGRSQGMRLLDDSLRELLDQHRISDEVALANCEDPRRLGG